MRTICSTQEVNCMTADELADVVGSEAGKELTSLDSHGGSIDLTKEARKALGQ